MFRISDPAPMTHDLKPRRDRGVRCIRFVWAYLLAPLRSAAIHPFGLGRTLYPSPDTGQVLCELRAELFGQGAFLGLDLKPSHVGDKRRQEKCRSSIRQV